MKKQAYITFTLLAVMTWLCSEVFVLIAAEEIHPPAHLFLVSFVFLLGIFFTYIGAPLTYCIAKIVEFFGTDPYTIVYPGLYPLTNTVSVLILAFVFIKIYTFYKKS